MNLKTKHIRGLGREKTISEFSQVLKSCILLLKTLEVYLFSLNNRTEILVYIIAQRSGKMMFQISIPPCTHISFLLLWSQVHSMSHFQIEPSRKNSHTLGSMLSHLAKSSCKGQENFAAFLLILALAKPFFPFSLSWQWFWSLNRRILIPSSLPQTRGRRAEFICKSFVYVCSNLV